MRLTGRQFTLRRMMVVGPLIGIELGVIMRVASSDGNPTAFDWLFGATAVIVPQIVIVLLVCAALKSNTYRYVMAYKGPLRRERDWPAVAPKVDVEQTKQGTGIEARLWRGGLALLGVAITLCVCLTSLNDPAGFLVLQCLLLVVPLFVVGSLCAGLAALVLRSIKKQVRRLGEAPLADETCGPIVWEGWDDGLEPR
jgi:hypothetical protein